MAVTLQGSYIPSEQKTRDRYPTWQTVSSQAAFHISDDQQPFLAFIWTDETFYATTWEMPEQELCGQSGLC